MIFSLELFYRDNSKRWHLVDTERRYGILVLHRVNHHKHVEAQTVNNA